MRGPATRAPITALAVTLAVQGLAALTLTTPSVLAPVVAADIGVPARSVGWLVGIAYLAAMISGLSGGSLSQRFGPVRLSQVALLACAVGLALLAVGNVGALLFAAVVIGIGYGLPNPTAAAILAHHAPADRRGLFFSIKQTGVPIGVAVTGLALPALLAVFSWRTATLLLLLPIAALTLWLQRPRAVLEGTAPGDRPRARPMGFVAALRTDWLMPLRDVLAFAPTRRLAIVSLVYAFTQVSFLTFLVSLLHLERGHSLALAAGLLAASQAVSVVARIGWGHVSDRWADPSRLLGALGIAMAAGVAMLGALPATTPWPATLAVTMLCAGTAVAWNGVFFAELVRHVAPHEVARATGATQFMTFCGGMSGSAAFAAMVGLAGSYGAAFLALAVPPALSGAVLLVRRR